VISLRVFMTVKSCNRNGFLSDCCLFKCHSPVFHCILQDLFRYYSHKFFVMLTDKILLIFIHSYLCYMYKYVNINAYFMYKTIFFQAHMKTHDGSRDYGCDLCGCRFTTSGSLKRHMIVHNDERYYNFKRNVIYW
jgi:hypothetical protein